MSVKKFTAKSLTLSWLKAHEVTARNTKVGLNFNYEGWNFLLWHDADDPLFFRLALPGILDVTDRNYAQALMACNDVNWNYKVVKASLYEYDEASKRKASVWVSFEQMLDDEASPEIVTRAVNALIDVAERLVERLEEA